MIALLIALTIVASPDTNLTRTATVSSFDKCLEAYRAAHEARVAMETKADKCAVMLHACEAKKAIRDQTLTESVTPPVTVTPPSNTSHVLADIVSAIGASGGATVGAVGCRAANCDWGQTAGVVAASALIGFGIAQFVMWVGKDD